jgi:lipopolysaccharide/colanic/teichoic acid biosynthesis glycosyltransferase
VAARSSSLSIANRTARFGPRAKSHTDQTTRAFWFKNIVEPPLALLILALASPLLLIIAAAIKLTSPGPVIYRRRVAGRHGREFDAFKFRTMVTDAEKVLDSDASLKQKFMVNYKLQDDPRVTQLGRFLRKYSVDELPQLLNVIRGEMWLIGPRMVTPAELDRYGAHRSKLMTVKPGMTGLWQVSGRQTTSYEERVELDMRYIDQWSAWLDVSILLRTIGAVFRAEGAY